MDCIRDNWEIARQNISDRHFISNKVSNIGFITVHGLNEGHIAPYTDIEFQLTKYQSYISMKSQDKSLQLISEIITLLTEIKRVK